MSLQVSNPSHHFVKDKYNETPWRLAYDQGPPIVHHQFDAGYTYLDNSYFPLSEDHYTPPHQPRVPLMDRSPSMFAPAPTLLPCPSSGSDTEIQSHQNTLEPHRVRDQCSSQTAWQTPRRRAQNREAQRRFRQKEEERRRTLEEKIRRLETRCKELTEELSQTSKQALQLERDRSELEEQVQKLRRQGQMLVRVVRQPALVQSFASLVALTQP